MNIPIDYGSEMTGKRALVFVFSAKRIIGDQQTQHLLEAKHMRKKTKANSWSELHPIGVA